MPRIHAVWDPQSSVQPPPPEVAKKIGVKVAVLDVREGIQEHEIAKIAQELAVMLLQQIRE